MIIECTLTASSLAKAAKELEKYAESLTGKTEKLVQSLGEKGAEQAVAHLKHVDTGETRDSIQYTHDGTSGTVSVGGAAVWIEFGTGVIANSENTPHPKKDEVGAVGWGEYGHGIGKRRWWFINKNGEKKWTNGIPMNPFMYSASQDMRRDLLKIAKEVFKVD